VWGEDDPHFGPEWGRRLREDIPGARRLELLPHTGHLLMEERPGELARLVAGFLVRPPGAGPAGSCSGPAAAGHEEGAHHHG
jgi:cis-3-alkyl-4-acyloxetan-2-one decarboxylase